MLCILLLITFDNTRWSRLPFMEYFDCIKVQCLATPVIYSRKRKTQIDNSPFNSTATELFIIPNHIILTFSCFNGSSINS